MIFSDLKNKSFFITGIANKKSIAYHVATLLKQFGATIILSVQNKTIKEKLSKIFPSEDIFVCDVTQENEFQNLKEDLEKKNVKLDGLLHSLAFANFSDKRKSFHETTPQNFQEAISISALSLTYMANTLKKFLKKEASVVTVSISDIKATAYGYLGPIKAMLNATIPFLAKSFSEFSNIRFNAVCAGPLKTSASSGIPNFIDNYIFSEQLTLRKEGLKTTEVAYTICFLLSSFSSGINAQEIVVDAGMSCNHFDQKIVKTVAENLPYKK